MWIPVWRGGRIPRKLKKRVCLIPGDPRPCLDYERAAAFGWFKARFACGHHLDSVPNHAGIYLPRS